MLYVKEVSTVFFPFSLQCERVCVCLEQSFDGMTVF